MISSNVIAAQHDIRVQRNASFAYYFQLRNSDGDILTPSTTHAVRAQVRNVSGKVVSAFEIGDGLEWYEDQSGWVIIMSKLDSEKNIAPGAYTWDMLVAIVEDYNQYPLRGAYVVINNITE